MKINTALILCAGFGKRLNPVTLETPKPLLKINDLSLLDHCIELIIDLGIDKILINTFYLKKKFHEYFENHNYNADIKIVEDGDNILDTGGGIVNLIKKSNDENFLVFNPDTIWNKNYINEINTMSELFFSKKIKNLLLLANKDLSFDKDIKGDFGLQNFLINQKSKKFIYTGCQILNRSVLEKEKPTNFSMVKIWHDLIKNHQLYGFESKINFYHITNLKIFKKLKDL
jgi:MurNAc alpha-1-phosphate uridylyltransferase